MLFKVQTKQSMAKKWIKQRSLRCACFCNTATAVLHATGLSGLIAATLTVFVITTVICTIHFTFFHKV